MKEKDGCTCGNLIYDNRIVGASGHMRDCPHYTIWRLEGELCEAKSMLKEFMDWTKYKATPFAKRVAEFLGEE